MMANNGSTSVTQESIKALYQLKSDLEMTVEQMHKEISRLHDVFDENKSGLGAHSGEIQSLLESLGEQVETSSVPVKRLTMKLNTAAMIRKKLL